jgi:hypothetical protein
MIRTGRNAIPAANAAHRNMVYYASLLVSVRSSYRADKGARRVMWCIAVKTGSGQIGRAVLRIGLTIFKMKNLQPRNRSQFIGLVLSERDVVLLLACY